MFIRDKTSLIRQYHDTAATVQPYIHPLFWHRFQLYRCLTNKKTGGQMMKEEAAKQSRCPLRAVQVSLKSNASIPREPYKCATNVMQVSSTNDRNAHRTASFFHGTPVRFKVANHESRPSDNGFENTCFILSNAIRAPRKIHKKQEMHICIFHLSQQPFSIQPFAVKLHSGGIFHPPSEAVLPDLVFSQTDSLLSPCFHLSNHSPEQSPNHTKSIIGPAIITGNEFRPF